MILLELCKGVDTKRDVSFKSWCGFHIGTFFLRKTLTPEPLLGHLAQGQNLCLCASPRRKCLMSPSVQVTRVSLTGRTLPLERRRLVTSPPLIVRAGRNLHGTLRISTASVARQSLCNCLPASQPHTSFQRAEHKPQGHVCKPHMCLCTHHTHVHTHLRGQPIWNLSSYLWTKLCHGTTIVLITQKGVGAPAVFTEDPGSSHSCNSSSRQANALYCPLGAPGTRVVHVYTCRLTPTQI